MRATQEPTIQKRLNELIKNIQAKTNKWKDNKYNKN